MPGETATNYNDIAESVRVFNEGLEEGEDLETLLSYFRSWYFIPELGMVAPSKFVGYKRMTAAEYMRRDDLDGRITEPVLGRWFVVLREGTREAEHVRQLVGSLLAGYGKSLNRMARFNAPPGWRFRGQGTTQRNGQQPPKHPIGQEPLVEVLWRAFLSLDPEHQDSLAERIAGHRNRE